MRRLHKNIKSYKQIKKELKHLYKIYKELNKTKTDMYQLDKIISEISLLEYKYIKQLQQRLK